MNNRILITGASGLVGSALVTTLESEGAEVVALDLRARPPQRGDVRDRARVREAIHDCAGVIHLAAVSRVIWGERDPELCHETNVGGLRNVLEAAASSRRAPWLVFASSREIYGQASQLPATEDTPARPVNVYGRTKVEGEALVEAARRDGLRACTMRLSNVFGSTSDHPDRVVPAFARGVVEGAPLRVDGASNTFDFTHIDDVARGVTSLAALLSAGEAPPPPIHFVTGVPTTLGELAELAIELAELGELASIIEHAPPRDFDVAHFYGDPSRARALLGWRPRVGLREGLARLIDAYRHEAELAHEQRSAAQ